MYTKKNATTLMLVDKLE